MFRTVFSLGLLLSLAACGARVSPETDAAMRDATVGGDAASDAGATNDSAPMSDAPSASCVALNERSVRAPSVVRGGERTPIAAVADGAGCGCQPTVTTRGPKDYALRACECNNSNPCVDPSYVVNWNDAASPAPAEPAAETVRVGTLSANITRLPRVYRCAGGTVSVDANGVTIESDNDARVSGPRRVWAFVRGTSARCSNNPMVLVTATGTSPIRLSVEDCNNTDCDGPRGPRSFGVWVMLGEFAPGMYSIFYPPGISQTFTVR
ncbi:MAG: hypothetical protein U0269_27440 [Polyangiales bacterium]